MNPYVCSSTINNSQIMEAAQRPPIDEWINFCYFQVTVGLSGCNPIKSRERSVEDY